MAGILANIANGFGDVFDLPTLRLFLLETPFGTVAILRLILLASAVLVSLWPGRNRAWFSALLHIGALLLINQAWLGHAAEGGAGPYGALMIATYNLHVLAVAAWVGGLPPLLFALIEQGFRERKLILCQRFSWMGIVAVALAVPTGLANAGFRTGFSLERLLHTDYGDVLLAKAGVVAAMLALAAYNRFVAMPDLAKPDPTPKNRLRASVAAELLLGILALGAAALLGVTPPPQ
jgi:putative copper resistance protein D